MTAGHVARPAENPDHRPSTHGVGQASPAAVAAAAILCFVGGYVDAFGFLLLRGVYLGNMTGDTVRLGVAVARNDWGSVAVALQPIVSFGIGLLLGALIQDLIRMAKGRRLLPIPLFAEAACLITIWLRAPGAQWPDALLGGIAMGIQNTILRNSGVMSMYTTHVTGLLTELSEHVSAVLSNFMRVPHVRAGQGDFALPPDAPRVRHARVAGRLATFYVLWLAGVFAAALISTLWATHAALPPAVIVFVLGVVTLVRPIQADK